jgi:hyperosmotically inducible periplasmic protein
VSNFVVDLLLGEEKMATKTKGWLSSVTALALAVAIAQAVPNAIAETAPNDSRIQAELTKSLSNAKFKDIHTSVQNGIVSLTGSVNVYAVKADAEKKAHKAKAIAVRDNIQVTGPTVPDEVLQRKLMGKIQSDRIGYGTTTFNAISVAVESGVVTLGGSAYGPVDKDYAIADASYAAGVKDVVDNIQVDPVSMFDNRIRIATARAVYGYPSLNKYAIDPARPIRIVVQNGNVTLEGVVMNKMDKEVAGLRANGVPGVFKVTNDLQVANQQSERN